MISSTTTRTRKTALAAAMLFAAVWLNMAVQPCLMAAEPLLPSPHEQGDCPHCPKTGHCEDDARCGFIDGYDFDGREPAKPDAEPFVTLVVGIPAPTFGPPSRAHGPPPEPQGLDPGPPLFLRNCCFLN